LECWIVISKSIKNIEIKKENIYGWLRFRLADHEKDWAHAIAMMRHGFGSYPFGTDEVIVHERCYGRVGEFYQDDGK